MVIFSRSLIFACELYYVAYIGKRTTWVVIRKRTFLWLTLFRWFTASGSERTCLRMNDDSVVRIMLMTPWRSADHWLFDHRLRTFLWLLLSLIIHRVSSGRACLQTDGRCLDIDIINGFPLINKKAQMAHGLSCALTKMETIDRYEVCTSYL